MYFILSNSLIDIYILLILNSFRETHSILKDEKQEEIFSFKGLQTSALL